MLAASTSEGLTAAGQSGRQMYLGTGPAPVTDSVRGAAGTAFCLLARAAWRIACLTGA